MREGGEPLFRIGRTDTQITGDVASAERLFKHQRALLCRGAVESDLLAQLAKATAHAHFTADPVPQIGHRWIEQPVRIGVAIETVINRPGLRHWLSAVTGVADLGNAEGRLVQTRPGGIDGLGWHDDQIPRAQLGITVHLRDRDYTGGAFELRRKDEAHCRFAHADPRAGDIVVFDVSDACIHRVQPVSAGAARLVFTGWFMAAD